MKRKNINKMIFAAFILGLMLFLLTSPTGITSAQGSAWLENWNAASSSTFNLMDLSGGTGNSATSNVADSGAADGRALRLMLNTGSLAGPEEGANIKSKVLYGYGTYKTRMKTVDCSAQPNAGIITGFFTYFNDGRDTNSNGLADNSEIDIEVLCADPKNILMTVWTDYRASDEAHKRVYREVNLQTGQVVLTCYTTAWGECQAVGSGESQPASVTAIPGFNSSTAYYEYGFTWAPGRVTWWIMHPTTGQQIILWDYIDPYAGTNNARVPSLEAYYMTNAWHHAGWTPSTCCGGAVEAPSALKYLYVDWTEFIPQGVSPNTPTRTRTPGGPTDTPIPPTITPTSTRTSTPGPTPVAGALRLQYNNLNPTSLSTQIQFWLKLVNTGATPVNYADLKARYYFTGDASPLNATAACQGASVIGCSNVTLQLVPVASPVSSADWYLEVGFTGGAGALPAYGDSAEIQLVISRQGGTPYFNQPGDFSFDATKLGFADWTNIPLYQSGILAWGIDPLGGTGPTATRTNTPPAATATRTNTPPVATATRTSTPSAATNLALNRPIAALSIEGAGFEAFKAVDGNPATRWASIEPATTAQWLRVDLGSTRSITRVKLNWEAAYARSYTVQVSNNNSTWQTIYSTTTGNGAIDDLTGLTGSGRYVRIYMTVRGTPYGYSLWEFEVYGY